MFYEAMIIIMQRICSPLTNYITGFLTVITMFRLSGPVDAEWKAIEKPYLSGLRLFMDPGHDSQRRKSGDDMAIR